MIDVLHISVGIIVSLCAFFAFVAPEEYAGLMPLIFFLSAGLNGVNGWYHIHTAGKNSRRKFWGIALFVIAVLLLALSVFSGISIWRIFDVTR